MSALEEMIAIQELSGNWDFDPYMHGMLNGMILAQAIIDGKEPQFREAPKKWLAESMGVPQGVEVGTVPKWVDTVEVRE